MLKKNIKGLSVGIFRFAGAMVVTACCYLVAGPAAAQLNVANDFTTNAGCSLNYNDPDCWSGGVVPNNGVVNFAVVIDDSEPFIVNQNATVSTLQVAPGSLFSLPNTRQFTIQGNTGAGSGGTIINNGQLGVQSTGSFTAYRFTGGTTSITADTLPGPGNANIISSNDGSNFFFGSGAASNLTLTNQSVTFSGSWTSFGQVDIDNSRFKPNLNSTYIVSDIDELYLSNSSVSDETLSVLRMSNMSVFGNGNSEVVAQSGGTVQFADIDFATAIRYAADFGDIEIDNSTVSDSSFRALASGEIVIKRAVTLQTGLNERTDIGLDNGGQLTFDNASTTTLVGNVDINIGNNSRVNMGSTGSPTIVAHQGDGVSKVRYISPGFSGFQSLVEFTPDPQNVWQGTGTDPALELNGIGMRGTGSVQGFTRIDVFDSEIENNGGTRFAFDNNQGLNVANSTLRARGALGVSGEFIVVDSQLDGQGSTSIEATDGGSFVGRRGSFSNFDAVANEGSRIGFESTVVNNANLSTQGTGLVAYLNTELNSVTTSGNIQAGGDFTINGPGTSFNTLVQDPSTALRIQYANGAEQSGTILFDPNRVGNQLSSTGNLRLNGTVAGGFTVGAVDVSAGGRINATGTVLFSAPGSNIEGEVAVDGGVLKVNADIGGQAGRWQIRNGGSFEVLNGTSVQGDTLDVQSSQLFLQGGGLIYNEVTIGIDSEVVVGSTLSTGRLSIGLVDESAWGLSPTTVVEMTGGVGSAIGEWSDWGILELAGQDLGQDAAGFSDNFEIPTLSIGAGANVLLFDLLDNGNRGGGGGEAEALYVDRLIFQDSSGLLNLNGLNLYFNELVGAESQIFSQVVPVPAAVWLFLSALGLLGSLSRHQGTRPARQLTA